MSAIPTNVDTAPTLSARTGWMTRLIRNPRFQAWAAHFPLTRRKVRKEGEAIFGLIAGFCHSQILMALVKLGILDALVDGPRSLAGLSVLSRVPEERMAVLLRSACALGLLGKTRSGTYRLTHTGAALTGVPGLTAMIAHHDVLYRDLANPAAFFRGETETELADFWPYVFGGDMAPEVARTYSDLMAQSQQMVALDTLRTVSLPNAATIMDVGGGTGAFLEAFAAKYPDTKLTLFDLPQVAHSAEARFQAAGLAERADIRTGSFKTDPLPPGADLISLVRVLYDHDDATTLQLLCKCFDALPPRGRLLVSEPMSGGDRPNPATDAYFALYTLAMRTGKTRSAEEISDLCVQAGFSQIKVYSPRRAFVTQCLVAQKAP